MSIARGRSGNHCGPGGAAGLISGSSRPIAGPSAVGTFASMARVTFTDNIQRHVSCPPQEVEGATVREALEAVFAGNGRARGYVLDEAGAVRQHMVIFVDGQAIADRQGLSDAVGPDGEVYVMQALSGG